jgi:hypothetical protein
MSDGVTAVQLCGGGGGGQAATAARGRQGPQGCKSSALRFEGRKLKPIACISAAVSVGAGLSTGLHTDVTPNVTEL